MAVVQLPDSFLTQNSRAFPVSDITGSQRIFVLIASREVNGGWVSCAPGAGMIAQGDSREDSLRISEELVLEDLEDCLQTSDPLPQLRIFPDICGAYTHFRIAAFELVNR